MASRSLTARFTASTVTFALIAPLAFASAATFAMDDSTPPSKDAPTKPGAAKKSSSKSKGGDDPETNSKLQLKLDPEDRQALERSLKYTLAEIPASGIEWIGSDALTVEALKPRVVVIQSVSVRGNWRSVIEPLRRQMKETSEPVAVILLHTPEGADNAKKVLEPALDGWMGIVDSEGGWCDELGVWKRPVNFVVDRNGVVRYAGLTPEGVRAAVEILLRETANPEAEPKMRPKETSAAAKFPTFRDSVGGATDQRGKEMPTFTVESWINGQPDPGQRVIVIDFWATWCGPCRQAIPHMNEFAQKFSNDACFVGLSDESRSKFEEGCVKHNLKERDFKYALALDSKARLKEFFGISGIPHCVVVSSDGVVRWQGHPMNLSEESLRSIIGANKTLDHSRSAATGRSWKDAGAEKPDRTRSAPPKRKGY